MLKLLLTTRFISVWRGERVGTRALRRHHLVGSQRALGAHGRRSGAAMSRGCVCGTRV
jgi:hypothetical protein